MKKITSMLHIISILMFASCLHASEDLSKPQIQDFLAVECYQPTIVISRYSYDQLLKVLAEQKENLKQRIEVVETIDESIIEIGAQQKHIKLVATMMAFSVEQLQNKYRQEKKQRCLESYKNAINEIDKVLNDPILMEYYKLKAEQSAMKKAQNDTTVIDVRLKELKPKVPCYADILCL